MITQTRGGLPQKPPKGGVMKLSPILITVLTGAIVCPASVAMAVTPPIPIPNAAVPSPVPGFIGTPAWQYPLFPPAIPGNPSQARNPWNSVHNDPYASDTYTTAGPLGRAPRVISTWLGSAELPVNLVVGATFDKRGHMVAAGTIADTTTGKAFVRMYLLDSASMAILATYDLPVQTFDPSDVLFRPAGTYFYADAANRTVIGTSERKIAVLSHDEAAFTLDKTVDLRRTIPADDEFESLQPDFDGHTWFATKGGLMGTVDLDKGRVLGTYRMAGEKILNSMAADSEGGLYVASDARMYRFDTTAKGKPKVTWRQRYDAGDRVKPGQVGLGTGTTPTLMGEKYVAITDNADPRMHVVVYRRAATVKGPRVLCKVPVFQKGTSATENSLIGTNRSLIVENNYGYASMDVTTNGATTTPGITRIDVKSGTCFKKWTNTSVSVPSVVSKLSVANGLIYSYTKPQGPGTSDPWYFTAVDFRTGKVAYRVLTGTGKLYNNHYAPVYLGPDGAAFVGVLGGIVRVSDG